MERRIFYVNRSPVPGYSSIKGIYEEDLKDEDYIYLYNKCIKAFNESPEMVQINFFNMLAQQYAKIKQNLEAKENETTNKEGGESSSPDTEPTETSSGTN
tara:strand:+ start:83 stop:382 length:300 start_codon:yes stop_codon:yes gene_type:complete